MTAPFWQVLATLVAQTGLLLTFIRVWLSHQDKNYTKIASNYDKIAETLLKLREDLNTLKLDVVGEYVKKDNVNKLWDLARGIEERVIRLEAKEKD